jgi:hypothetical protein
LPLNPTKEGYETFTRYPLHIPEFEEKFRIKLQTEQKQNEEKLRYLELIATKATQAQRYEQLLRQQQEQA